MSRKNSTSQADKIAAAGGVVWRMNAGKLELAVIHRPRYDDWTLPKGKLELGEAEITCAVREVGEELGSEVAVQRRIGRVKYRVATGEKTVQYWVMRHVGGGFAPNSESDDVLWLRPGKARKQLSYDVDRTVLAGFAATPVPEAIIILVRHAKAGKRSDWSGPDADRPLDESGLQQADDLVPFLRYFAPSRVIAADRVRCIQTVAPLAAALATGIEVDPAFSDDAHVKHPTATMTSLFSLNKPDAVSVVCSQGNTIPSLLDRLAPSRSADETRKADSWVLAFVDGEVLSADFYEAPHR